METWRKRKREPAPPGCISVSIFFPRFLQTPCACVQRGDSRGRCAPTERWRQPPKPDLRRSSSLSPGQSCKSSKCRVHARRQRGRDAPRRWLRQCHRETSRPQHASNTRLVLQADNGKRSRTKPLAIIGFPKRLLRCFALHDHKTPRLAVHGGGSEANALQNIVQICFRHRFVSVFACRETLFGQFKKGHIIYRYKV